MEKKHLAKKQYKNKQLYIYTTRMITFYLAMRHARSDEVYQYIDDYSTSDTKYVISMEKCKNSHKETYGEHFHVVIEWEEKHYNKFKREVITKIWKLKGQARDGVGRQYGKEKVGDEDAMISYCLKDQEEQKPLHKVKFQNYTEEYLLKRYDLSYQKEDKYTQIENVINHLKDMPCMAPPLDIWKVQKSILEYWMNNHANVITKSTLNHITTKFITQVFKHNTDDDLDKILLYILGKSI